MSIFIYLSLSHGSAVKITTNRSPMIIGIGSEVVCTVSGHGVLQMEMMILNKTLAVSNDISEVSASLVPDHSMNGTDIVCRVSTTDGLRLENSIPLLLTGAFED